MPRELYAVDRGTAIVWSASLLHEVLHHIVTQTDGVPLFIEELTKAVLAALDLG